MNIVRMLVAGDREGHEEHIPYCWGTF
jgi:hypothetical protein